MPQQEMGEISTAIGALGNLSITLTSDVVDAQLLDTKVEVEGGLICWVHGEQRDEFLNELNDAIFNVVSKYRI